MWTPPTFSQGCGPVPVHRANVYGVISQSRTSLMLKHDCTTWGAGWSGESLEGIIEGELSHWRHSMVSCSEVHASCNSCIINGALAVTLRMCLLLQLFSIVPLQPWYPCRAPPPKLLCLWVAVVKLSRQTSLTKTFSVFVLLYKLYSIQVHDLTKVGGTSDRYCACDCVEGSCTTIMTIIV